MKKLCDLVSRREGKERWIFFYKINNLPIVLMICCSMEIL